MARRRDDFFVVAAVETFGVEWKNSKSTTEEEEEEVWTVRVGMRGSGWSKKINIIERS